MGRREREQQERDPNFVPPFGHSGCLDGQHARKMFEGKTAAQAEEMFRKRFDFHQEDLCYMDGPTFCFYVRPAIKYLLSADANGDSDAASSFCRLISLRLEFEPATLVPIGSFLTEVVEQLLVDFDRFECTPENYGDVPAQYRELLRKLPQGME